MATTAPAPPQQQLDPDEVEVMDPGDPVEGTAAGAGKLDGVPQFARDNVDWNTVKEVPAPEKQVAPGLNIAADVPRGSRTIEVRAPDHYTAPVRGHESTHVAQQEIADNSQGGLLDQAESAIGSGVSAAKNYLSAAPVKSKVDTLAAYDYGGKQGLIDRWNRGESPGDMGEEQQAKAVQDYIESSRAFEQKLRSGHANNADLEQYSELQKAYHPLIRALAPQPKGNTIDTHPEPPGPPTASELGYMVPEKGMGGGYTMPGAPKVPYAVGGPLQDMVSPQGHFVKPGTGQPLSVKDAETYLAKAKGNKGIARAMAQHDGHKF